MLCEAEAIMPMKQNATETEHMADQLRRVYEGPSWLGPSIKGLLSDVDEERARRRTLPGAHTIWELVLHITAWLRVARERLDATEICEPDSAEDWPPIGGDWGEAKTALESEIHATEQAILKFPDERLEEQAPAIEPQTFYQLLHGVIQHSAYHAGQIAVLKKRV